MIIADLRGDYLSKNIDPINPKERLIENFCEILINDKHYIVTHFCMDKLKVDLMNFDRSKNDKFIIISDGGEIEIEYDIVKSILIKDII